jgi:hypothetical protein
MEVAHPRRMYPSTFQAAMGFPDKYSHQFLQTVCLGKFQSPRLFGYSLLLPLRMFLLVAAYMMGAALVLDYAE